MQSHLPMVAVISVTIIVPVVIAPICRIGLAGQCFVKRLPPLASRVHMVPCRKPLIEASMILFAYNVPV